MATGQPIYLDYNATTPMLPEVVDAMFRTLRLPNTLNVRFPGVTGSALGSVRLTLGRGTTDAEIGRAAEALVRAWCAVTSWRRPA